MLVLSIREGDEVLGLGGVGAFVVGLAERLRTANAFAIPSDAGRKTALASLIARLLPNETQVLLWVTGWGVWPSCENWDLFYGYRRSAGEKRQLMEAPLHVFSSAEREALASVLSMVFFFGWDANIVGMTGDFMVTVSHDEWLETRSNSITEEEEIVQALEQYDVKRLL